MFDIATRQKLRFESPKGLLSIEDLWDLPLTSATGKANLDEIALTLHHQLKNTADVVSFVDDDKAKPDAVIQLKFNLVKHIIELRKKENAEALAARDRAETKQRLLAALAKKREAAVDTMSEEDLLKKIAEL